MIHIEEFLEQLGLLQLLKHLQSINLLEVLVSLFVPPLPRVPSNIPTRKQGYIRLLVPYLLFLRVAIPKEYIYLLLSCAIIKVVIVMPGDGGEKLEPLSRAFIYLLFMRQGASVLNRNEIPHLFVQCSVLFEH